MNMPGLALTKNANIIKKYWALRLGICVESLRIPLLLMLRMVIRYAFRNQRNAMLKYFKACEKTV